MADANVEQTNVKVMVRVRPFAARELNMESADHPPQSVILMEGPTVRVLDPERDYCEKDAFDFDHAFWSITESQNQYSPNKFATQSDVFDVTGAPAVVNALRGFHCCIFAYGQTGSGKTYTMLGSDNDEGIAPRLVRRLFAAVKEEKSKSNSDRVQYTVELSFLEIYNERVKDLLGLSGDLRTGSSSKPSNKGGDYAECRVRYHPGKGTFVEGLTRMVIEGEEQCLAAIKEGMEHRAVASTLMNDTSSRSHAIFQICLSQKSPLRGTSRVSIINLVDLAGSERIKLSGVTGQALTEAKNINLSLSTLRRVIDILIDNTKLKKGQRPALPPYREALLTWVLSDSLGGNSKTMMVAAISPHASNIEDTMGTLRYALKAKAIVCNAKVNEEKTAAVVGALRAEMEELRRQLEEKHDADNAEQDRLQAALLTREQEFNTLQDEVQHMEQLKTQYEAELHEKAEELAAAQEQMSLLQNVEEDKVRKEEELIRAREQQAATAEKLREQEEERRQKEDELKYHMARKESLKRLHDQALEDEAKARLAAEQARYRQFASAFQNAFVLRKHKSGLEELQTEHAQLAAMVKEKEEELAARERELESAMTEKSMLRRKTEVLEKKQVMMEKDLQEVLETKNRKLAELSAQKKAADEEHGRAQAELSQRQEELKRLEELFNKEREQSSKRIESLKEKKDDVSGRLAAKAQHLAELKQLLAEATARHQSLVASATEYDNQISKIRKENADRDEKISSLELREKTIVSQRQDLQKRLDTKRAELGETQRLLAEVTAEANSLRQTHNDLRQFVSLKFFPAGNRNMGPSAMQPVPRDPSPQSRPRNGHSPAARSSSANRVGSAGGPLSSRGRASAGPTGTVPGGYGGPAVARLVSPATPRTRSPATAAMKSSVAAPRGRK